MACIVWLVEPAVDRGVNGTQKAYVGGAATWLVRRVVEWYLVTVDWVNIAGGGISYTRLRELLLEKISQ